MWATAGLLVFDAGADRGVIAHSFPIRELASASYILTGKHGRAACHTDSIRLFRGAVCGPERAARGARRPRREQHGVAKGQSDFAIGKAYERLAKRCVCLAAIIEALPENLNSAAGRGKLVSTGRHRSRRFAAMAKGGMVSTALRFAPATGAVA